MATHSSSARMTQSCIFCQLSLYLTEILHKQLQHGVSQPLLIKHAPLMTSAAELTATGSSFSWSATNFRKWSIQLLSETAFAVLRGVLSTWVIVPFFPPHQISKVHGSFKLKPGMLLDISGFWLRPGAIWPLLSICSSSLTFKKQNAKVIFILVH